MGTLLIKTAKNVPLEQVKGVAARAGGNWKKSISKLDLHVVEVPAVAVDAFTKAAKSDPAVVRVEVNRPRKVRALPADPLYGQQWALPKIAWDGVFGVATPISWAKVAILDTGVDGSHPDLIGALAPGTSFLDDSEGLTDPVGHGTGLAGIVAARTSNGSGMAGVGFDFVQTMPVKVIGEDGLGYDAEIIQGVLYAADNGASVILMAFSGPGFSESLQEAIDYAWSRGVVMVAAAGNDGSNTASFPAGDRGVMGVSGTDGNDTLALGSNYGQSVFIAAPGVDVLGTSLKAGYASWSGTSAAAAIVAGSAALMRAIDPTLTNGMVVNRLARNAEAAGTQEQTGNGRVQLARAVADTNTDSIQPVGTAPLGSGGPFVGPYKTASVSSVAIVTPTGFSAVSATAHGTVTVPFAFTYTTGNSTTSVMYTVYLRRSNTDYQIASATVTGLSNGAHAIGTAASPLTASVTFDGASGHPPANTGATNENYTLKVLVAKVDGTGTPSGNAESAIDWVVVAPPGPFTYATTAGKAAAVSIVAGTSNATTVSTDVTAPAGNAEFDVTLSFATLPGTTIGIGSGTNQINLSAGSSHFVTTAAADTKSFAITAAAGSGVSAGSYQFRATANESAGTINDGTGFDFSVSVTVPSGSIASVTVGAQSGTATYGGLADDVTFAVTATRGANGTFTGNYSASGLPAGVTAAFVPLAGDSNGNSAIPGTTLTLTVGTAVAAGTYPFTVSLGGTSGSGSLNVIKATPTATLAVNNSPQTYDGTAKSATVTISTSSTPGSVSNILTGGAASQTEANTYSVTADFVPTDTSNYNTLTGLAAGSFVISKATPTATLAVSNSPQTYNGSAKSATVGISASSVPGTVSNILTGGAATQTNAGTYAVTANFVPDNSNYNTLTGLAAGDFVINKATPTATLAVSNSPQTYTGSPLAATVSVSTSSTPGTAQNILTGGAATKTIAGTYAVTADFVPTDTNNYNTLTGLSAGDFVINKATPTATLSVTNTPQNYTGLAQAATVGITASSTPGAVQNILTGGTATKTNAGSYAVTADFVPTDTTNYNTLTGVAAGNFVINKVQLTVNAEAKGKIYGNADPAWTWTYAGFVNSENGVSAGITGAASCTRAPGETVAGNPYPISCAPGTLAATNYSFTTGSSANLTISKRTVTASIIAANKEFDNTLLAQITSCSLDAAAGNTGVIAGDVGSVGCLASNGLFANLNAGTWTVTANVALQGAASGNYQLSSATATTTATITVNDDAVARYIGQSIFVTSGANSSTAQVTLTASVTDPTGLGLAGAKVTFIDTLTKKVLAKDVPVSAVPGSPASSGTANATVTLSSGQYGSESYVILVSLGGNYTNEGQLLADKTATVVVTQPAAANTIRGGGTIIDGELTSVAGAYGSSLTATYSVGLSFNKQGTNLQGQVKVTIPQANGTTIVIKSNSLTSMLVTNISGGRTATVYAKASISRVNEDLSVTALDGNITLRLDVQDMTVSANDAIGFTVLSTKDSLLYYSNDWYFDAATKTWKTRVQTLASGTIAIGG